MKRQWRRLLTITGILCMMSLALYGCKDVSKPSDAEAEDLSAQDAEEGADIEEEKEDEDAASSSGEDTPSAPQEGKEADLLGDISELGEMQFTVSEAISEESEDGGSIIVGAAEGADDSEFNHVTVVYDEDTMFYIRKIYDNGARHEDLDASAEDLETNVFVNVWGDYEDGGQMLHAAKVQINQVFR